MEPNEAGFSKNSKSRQIFTPFPTGYVSGGFSISSVEGALSVVEHILN